LDELLGLKDLESKKKYSLKKTNKLKTKKKEWRYGQNRVIKFLQGYSVSEFRVISDDKVWDFKK
jgi:hypothetical protein